MKENDNKVKTFSRARVIASIKNQYINMKAHEESVIASMKILSGLNSDTFRNNQYLVQGGMEEGRRLLYSICREFDIGFDEIDTEMKRWFQGEHA